MEQLKQLRWSSIIKPSVMALAFMLVHVSLALSDSPRERATLAGLSGVRVYVSEMDPDAEREGLTQSIFRTDVELRLRQAAIRALTQTELQDTAGSPVLHLLVSMFKSEVGVFSYRIDLGLWQLVRLVRDPSIASAAMTWSTSSGGIVGVRRLSTIREDVRDKVDQFINAYLAANPKR
jgi:hypothetical protein